jgi:excisionase family DNA binding protein
MSKSNEFNIDWIPDDMIFKVDQVAELLGVVPLTVRRWIYSGKLSSTNPGGHHRILGSHLKEILKKNSLKVFQNHLSNLDSKSYNEWLRKAKLTGKTVDLPSIFNRIPDYMLYNTSEIASLLGVHSSTVRVWVNQGDLKTLNPAGHHRIQGKDLKEFLFQRLTSKKRL